MCPPRAATTLAERYDMNIHWARDNRLPPEAPRPRPTNCWPPGNLEFLARYREWLLGGGISELVTYNFHVPMAGHVMGLTLKPHSELDPDTDLHCALDYIAAKQLGKSWTKNCRNSLVIFRRFLRLERGLGEEVKQRPFDVAAHAEGLPAWLVNELQRYQRVLQRNWRPARIEQNILRFWGKYLRMWSFFCTQRGVKQLADLKRQAVLDYLDSRLAAGLSAPGVNGELRILHTFLLFLQDEGYTVPNSLLRIPGLKLPDSLPKHLTDEQVMKLRNEFERAVQEAALPSKRRIAVLDRAAFYLLWQGALRLGEVEELRLEDLDLGRHRLSVRDGKGRVDRTVYLADSAVRALQEYLAVRGQGSSDHVFLYRNCALRKDLIRARLKDAGRRVGVKVYPHRLRHTCATQLLNAGCRVTSIQRFLGHKRLNTTMIYARAHDQTVADDYYAAMRRIEERMDVAREGQEKGEHVVKVEAIPEALSIAQQLAAPELSVNDRMIAAARLQHILRFNGLASPAVSITALTLPQSQ